MTQLATIEEMRADKSQQGEKESNDDRHRSFMESRCSRSQRDLGAAEAECWTPPVLTSLRRIE